MRQRTGKAAISDAEALRIWWEMEPPRSYRKWMHRTGIGKTRLERMKKAHSLADARLAAAPPPESSPMFEDAGDEASAASVSHDIRTLDDLLAACKPDLDIWAVDRWVANKWQVWSKDAEGGGYRDLWQVKAWFRRRVPHATLDARDWYARELDSLTRDRPVFRGAAKAQPKGKHLLEISIFDLHLGKHAWHEETGYGDYDLQIADGLLHDAINYLYDVAPAQSIGRVLLPIGNDLYHIDTVMGTTTAGTPQDVDGRWQKIWRTGFRTYAAAIERIASCCCVDVVIVPGNHDFMSCFYLGETLAAHFKDHPNVTVDNRANPVKYYRYGVTQLGFAHGKGKGWRKPEEMAMRMARDVGVQDSRFQEWHLGHLHHHQTKESFGVVCRTLPSLTPPDAWHASEGYVGNRRAAVAFLYHETRGPVAEYSYHAD